MTIRFCLPIQIFENTKVIKRWPKIKRIHFFYITYGISSFLKILLYFPGKGFLGHIRYRWKAKLDFVIDTLIG